jgi:hypothetical protein
LSERASSERDQVCNNQVLGVVLAAELVSHGAHAEVRAATASWGPNARATNSRWCRS